LFFYLNIFIYLFSVDEDHDLRLSKEELIDYVFRNIQLHLHDAQDKNSQLFLLIDTDQNGIKIFVLILNF
jgi:hypothetical protein